MKKQFFTKPFNLIYEYNYPNLYLGPGIYKTKENAKHSSPREWVKRPIKKIEEIRKKQEFSFKPFKKTDAKYPNKYLEDIQWIASTQNPTELEIDLTNIKKNITDEISGIKNKSYIYKNLKITHNIKVPKSIDKIINDNDIKAETGINELYKKNDVYKIEQLFSVGLLGRKHKRSLVPTKWAITGVDDSLSKNIINNILYNQTIDKIELYTYRFYKNKFYIILFPNTWGFEMIESKNNQLIIDYENNYPKKDYAENITGAYYSARLEISKQLQKRKRQAKVLVLRDIDSDYESKGVWVIREAVREAIKKPKIEFETFELLKTYLDKINIKNGINYWIKNSTIIKENYSQKKLNQYF